jgi:hypothetical protein
MAITNTLLGVGMRMYGGHVYVCGGIVSEYRHGHRAWM